MFIDKLGLENVYSSTIAFGSLIAIAMWYSTILKAHQMNQRVVVGYDPVNFEVWYVAKPRP